MTPSSTAVFAALALLTAVTGEIHILMLCPTSDEMLSMFWEISVHFIFPQSEWDSSVGLNRPESEVIEPFYLFVFYNVSRTVCHSVTCTRRLSSCSCSSLGIIMNMPVLIFQSVVSTVCGWTKHFNCSSNICNSLFFFWFQDKISRKTAKPQQITIWSIIHQWCGFIRRLLKAYVIYQRLLGWLH